MNLLLVGVMICSQLMFFYPHKIDKKTICLLVFIGLMIFSPLLNHPETMRWSTVLYGTLYCLFFIAYDVVLKNSSIKKTDYLILLKYLIYAYFIILVIQQVCVLIELPIFNVSNYSLSEKWKLNSLTSEPSHSAMFLGILMYCYNVIYLYGKEHKVSFKKKLLENRKVWISFIWCMITMLSASAMLYFLIILSQFINRRTILFVCCFVGISWGVAYHYNFKPVVRTTNIVIAVSSFDENKIMTTDLSASLRFIPTILCIKQMDLRTIDGWFGHGVDYGKIFIHKGLIGVEDGYTGGGMLLFGIEYGFLPFIVIIVFSFIICFDKNNFFTSLLFWILFVLLGGTNNQSTWICIILLYTNKTLVKRVQIGYVKTNSKYKLVQEII